MLHQLLLLVGGEPIAFAGIEFGFQLGEKLLVLQGRTVDFMLQLHAEVTTASRRVVQQIHPVARTDERGDAGQVTVLHPVRLAIMQGSHLHQVLQEGEFAGRKLVVLIQNYQTEEREFLFASGRAVEVEAIGVIVGQRLGHQESAKGGFAHPLTRADEQGRHGIGTTPHPARPLGSHAEQPLVETAYPMFRRRDTKGQGRDTVDAVPLGQPIHIGKERMVVRQTLGVKQAGHVLVPAVDAVVARIQTEGVCRTLGDRAKIGFSLAHYLCLLSQYIEPEVVMSTQILFQTL